ncbi:MAG: MurR/RpiR family transcriptional regulator [Lachnospiraceae bacterium]|jgi:DNA-binding MurR/RpiR family transcriptional regulator|nr:MurR/RpiR family transcriptional regulator [Lachnospiraceae bacterium]
MDDKNNVLRLMDEKYASFTKGRKRIADYIRQNYDKAAFQTAAEIGRETGLSESTIIRFSYCLGYESFPDMQENLQNIVRERLNSIRRMRVSYSGHTEAEVLEQVLESDIERIKLTAQSIDSGAFETAVDILMNSRRVYIIGIRNCAALATFLGFHLNLLCDDVFVVSTTNNSEVFEQLIHMNENDAIIGISFPRYSVLTLKALEFAGNRSAKVITITDSMHSPMVMYSSCNLIAVSDLISVADSLVAPMSVINALIVALSMKKKKEVAQTMETLEKLRDDYQAYGTDELNHFSPREAPPEKAEKPLDLSNIIEFYHKKGGTT